MTNRATSWLLVPLHTAATGTLLGFICRDRQEEPLVSPQRTNHTRQPSKAGGVRFRGADLMNGVLVSGGQGSVAACLPKAAI